MSKKNLTMVVDHKDKILVPEDNNMFLFILEDFHPGQRVTVTIEPYVRERTLNQNGLFFKYVDVIAKSTGEDKQTVKKEMKKRFGVTNDFGSLKSTKEYTTVEMNFLIENTRIFGVIELGITMPLPEDLKKNNIK